MIIKFSIHFNTSWGEELYITGSSAELGSNDIKNALKLSYTEGGIWEGEIKCSPAKERILTYRYFVKGENGIYYESGKGRTIALNSTTKEIIAQDQWQGNCIAAPFLSAPFSEVFFADENWPYTQTHINSNEMLLRVTVPNVEKGGKVYICGSCPELGEWDPGKGMPMRRMENLRWERSISTVNLSGRELEFKFVIKTANGNFIWEEGENRRIKVPKILKHNTVIKEFSAANFNLSHPRFSGVSIPVFSLRSRHSHGIGDFADLKTLVDWCKEVGFSMIQLLPINDTTAYMSWKDSYPYNCISTLALHPLYINLSEVGELQDKIAQSKYKAEGEELNKKEFVDYDGVLDSKIRFLREIYQQERDNTFAEPGYYSFTKHNKEWIYAYGAFCALRDKFHTANFREWGEYATFSQSLIKGLTKKGGELYDNIFFYIFVQYHLHKQMVHVKEYAHHHGVAIKGDIPIGICRDSVEAWQYPILFNFNQQAGAPPDFFSADGQNWGFPTYNWDEMEKDNYTWWKNRFSHFSTYFDAYRIDHILGFFRIWEIPYGQKSGVMGHFSPTLPLTPDEIAKWGLEGAINGLFVEDPYQEGKYHPMITGQQSEKFALLTHGQKEAYNHLHNYYFFQRHNEFWYRNAMKKLQQLIAATNMLTCGEDLGMLNESVSRCMGDLKILSLELQLMPKDKCCGLGDPHNFPYLSVCTTSTHDCETLRMWLGRVMGVKDASAQECYNSIKVNMEAPSMLAILPMQDWLSIDEKLRNPIASAERINDPSNPNHYWRYRMHLNIEDLIEAKELNTRISQLAKR